MNKVIVIIAISTLSSCGLRFGDYHAWQATYATSEMVNKNNIDNYQTEAIHQNLTEEEYNELINSCEKQAN